MSRIYQSFLTHQAIIRRIFRRYFSRPEDVEDLTQETFLKCFAAETTTDIQDAKAFLLRVAKNLALSEIKKKSHTTTDYLEDSVALEVLKDEEQQFVDSQIDGRRKLLALYQAIAALSEQDRRILMMRKMEKLKFKEIAKRLDLSLSTVQKRMAAALLACDAHLREQGYGPEEFSADTRSRPKGKAVVKPLTRAINRADIDLNESY